MPKVPKLQKLHGNARQGFVKPEQFLALLEEIPDDDFRDWLEWFGWTGMRNGETSSLTWEGLEQGKPSVVTLLAADAKMAESRRIPIVGPLAEIIDRRIERRLPDCPLIFHSTGRSFKARQGGLPQRFNEMWKRASSAIGVPDLRVYDLRRSAIRNLIHASVPELTAMKISGHKSRETFRRYAIEDPSELASAIEKVAAFVTPRPVRRGKVVTFSRTPTKRRQKGGNRQVF